MAVNSSYFARSMMAASLIATRFNAARKVPWIAMVIEKVMLQETVEVDLEELISDEKPPLTPEEVMQCAVWYHHNIEPDTQYEAASLQKWASLSPDYQQEKYKDYRRGLGNWWGRFDHRRQKRWIDAAVARYEQDARTRTATIISYEREKVEEDQ